MFENFVRNARTDRSNLLCSIDAYDKKSPSDHDYGSSGDGYPIPLSSTT